MAEPAPIRFGTSGWRGRLAEEVTLPRARALVWAIGRVVRAERPGARVLVAHDTRFLGERLMQEAVAVLAALGLRPQPVQGPVPTPLVAWAVRRRRAAAGLIFTASHNPPDYQGLKWIASWGGVATDAQARRIERLAARALRRSKPGAGLEDAWPSRPLALRESYLRALEGLLDRRAFRRAGLAVAYDAFHGAGAGVLDVLLGRLGLPVVALRTRADPRFGGDAPDPTPERLGGLARALRRLSRPRIGLATDGDADRLAVIDSDGRRLTESDVVALLVDHLARTGRLRRGVAISIATGSLVERVARDHGLPVRRYPIGFKHLSRALAEGSADAAGEESGGFALGAFGRDKDGILAGALVAELAARLRAPLRIRLRELERRYGSSRCARTALAATRELRARLARLERAAPQRVAGARVREVDRRDGLRLDLGDGFLMLRASGTEPVVRVYAEAPNEAELRRRLAAGCRLLRGGAC